MYIYTTLMQFMQVIFAFHLYIFVFIRIFIHFGFFSEKDPQPS